MLSPPDIYPVSGRFYGGDSEFMTADYDSDDFVTASTWRGGNSHLSGPQRRELPVQHLSVFRFPASKLTISLHPQLQ